MRLLRLLTRGGAGLAVLLVLLQLVRAALPVALALAAGRLVAVLVAASTGEEAAGAAILVAAAFLADQVVWLLIDPVRALLARRVDGDLRARVRLLAASVSRLDVLESAAFQDRVSRAVDSGTGVARDRSVGNAAVGQLELTVRMLSAAAAAALLATFSVPLAAGLLAVALTVRAFVRRQWMRIIDKLDADTAGQRYEFYLASQAVVGAAKDVRLYGLTDWFAGRFRAAAARTYGPVWRELLGVLSRQWWATGLLLVAGAAALGVPAVAVLSGDARPGQLVTAVLAGLAVLGISTMGQEAYDIEYGLRGLAAADELTARYAAEPAPRRVAAASRAPAVRFDDVVFSYPGSDRRVLDGLSLTLRPGEIVAVVGENGAGETTFVKLLAGLYRPDSGRITVDGADPHARRAPVTVLFQDFLRYPSTLRDNVTSAAPERGADDDAVRDALRRAGATGLPEDLGTLLWREGTGGTELSGGQWQRVALARALYAVDAGRRLLVLDEPTASLDVRAEAQFHEQVISRVRDTTTVLISHRLSTVRYADRILLFRDGRVAEDGTHDELLAAGGGYATFFTTQAAAFGEEAA
ncbi:ATP-binding cassette domain-containing protein [Couchioplanes azureus]|uniref:ATP-binding cassette domain-containing protein n=1 Tax=Couchioplanes caeruleus TaxID=56438 RepID=UPI0016704967|nr:ATP-binding cassette domain-containing protein [Couchioplanes caeruleus]GGQ59988.1 multidrug ABC transporter permease [Couchioplanes caeruleus subsp. azureus]